MKRYIILLLILCLIIGIVYNSRLNQSKNAFFQFSTSSSNTSHNVSSFGIMTYNIHHGGKTEHRPHLNKIAEKISGIDVQIIGLNEVDEYMPRSGFQKQYKLLGEKLRMNYVFGPSLNGVFSSYGNALLSSFPITDVTNYFLPVSSGDEPRSLLKANVKLASQKEITIMVTHLSPEKENRKKQLQWLEKYLQDRKKPFVLMGDFNSTKLSSIAGYKNLAQGINTFPASDPYAEIDKIFTNIEDFKNPEAININISDHLPLVAEYKNQTG